MMPDYLICVECESPVYVFEWKNDAATDAECIVCGNDDLAQFATEEDFEALSLDKRYL
jgi:hypothetical protein